MDGGQSEGQLPHSLQSNRGGTEGGRDNRKHGGAEGDMDGEDPSRDRIGDTEGGNRRERSKEDMQG